MNNNFYAGDICQPASSSSRSFTSPDESSLSPPSSTNNSNHSGEFNLTTSSFSHYNSQHQVRPILAHHNLSDTRLDWHRHQSHSIQQQQPAYRASERSNEHFIYRRANKRVQSPIKRPVLTSLNNRPAAYPRTPRHTWKRRQRRGDISSSEEIQQIAITIPRSILEQNKRGDSRSRSDEGFCASEENRAETDFEDTKTDFMNATDKIYENLCLQQQYPNACLPRQPPPEIRKNVVEEDEPLIYGRLTALLLSSARSNPKTRSKIQRTQAEIKSMLQIQAHISLNVEDEEIFSRNCALFGHQVAAKLRHINQQSPVDFQLQVKKLHKILYGLKKKNVIFGGFGRFIQKILKAI